MTVEHSGDHPLPRMFSGSAHTPEVSPADAPDAREITPTRRSRVSKGVRFGLPVLVAAAFAAGTVQLSANVRYDEVEAAFIATVTDAADARAALRHSLTLTQASHEAAVQVASADLGLLGAPPLLEHLHAVIATSTDTMAALEGQESAPLPAPSQKPIWAWELFPAATALEDQAALSATIAQSLAGAEQEAVDLHAELHEAASVLAESATDAVPSFEQAHVSARNETVLELRAAAMTMPREVLDTDFASAYARLNSAAATVAASAAGELAEKAGPLFEKRLEVEAYARSIAGGVLLDFDWAPIVNGRGWNGSAGGTATWNSGTGLGGFSTITLSDSVAEYWPSEVMQALVTHEVGHSITAKCYAMFDYQDREANEAWATAWAISLGHTADGNGVSIYGYPSQELIELAATCR